MHPSESQSTQTALSTIGEAWLVRRIAVAWTLGDHINSLGADVVAGQLEQKSESAKLHFGSHVGQKQRRTIMRRSLPDPLQGKVR